jgi:opacity protein-like surface antigen
MTRIVSFTHIQSIIFLCFCFFSHTAFAGYWYGSVDLGGGVSSIGEDNTITLFTSSSPTETNRYSVDQKYQATALIGLAGGYRFDVMPKMELALGASASYLTYATVNGTVHPLVNLAPDFDVMSFSYDAESYVLLFEPTLIYSLECPWRLFLKPSVGVAWNKLLNYTESRIPGSTTVPGPFSFRSHTQTSFAYAPSIGIEYAMTPHSSVQVGYQYFNAGDASLGTLPNQETNQQINAGTLSAHLVVVNLMFT